MPTSSTSGSAWTAATWYWQMLPAPTMPARKRGCARHQTPTRPLLDASASAVPATWPARASQVSCAMERERSARRSGSRSRARSPRPRPFPRPTRPARSTGRSARPPARGWNDRQPGGEVFAQLDRVAVGQLVRLEIGDECHVEALAVRGQRLVGRRPSRCTFGSFVECRGADELGADQGERPVGTQPGDLREQLHVDPVGDRPVEAEHGCGQAREVRGHRGVGRRVPRLKCSRSTPCGATWVSALNGRLASARASFTANTQSTRSSSTRSAGGCAPRPAARTATTRPRSSRPTATRRGARCSRPTFGRNVQSWKSAIRSRRRRSRSVRREDGAVDAAHEAALRQRQHQRREDPEVVLDVHGSAEELAQLAPDAAHVAAAPEAGSARGHRVEPQHPARPGELAQDVVVRRAVVVPVLGEGDYRRGHRLPDASCLVARSLVYRRKSCAASILVQGIRRRKRTPKKIAPSTSSSPRSRIRAADESSITGRAASPSAAVSAARGIASARL